MGAKMCARHAREAARKAAREAVGSNGGLWRTSPAVPNHCAMSRRPPGLARSRMQQVQYPREPAARYSDLEAGGRAKMPALQEGSLRATGPHDQADDVHRRSPVVILTAR
jgi:hypothetical protein